MNITPTRIADVKLIEPQIHRDGRGFLYESWNRQHLNSAGIDVDFEMGIRSRSVYGCVRGLHYQIAHPQAKLVRVVSGEVFDVAVDLRSSSPTFGEWVAAALSADNHHGLWIPEGFAHGFMVLSEMADIEYCLSDIYSPESARTIRWDDSDINIAWPKLTLSPIVSEADQQGVVLSKAEVYA